MDNKDNILNEDIEVINFFDDEESTNTETTQPQEVTTEQSVNLSQTMSMESQVDTNVTDGGSYTMPAVEPVMPEPTPVVETPAAPMNDPMPAVEPVMPEPTPVVETPAAPMNDPMPEMEPVMPEPTPVVEAPAPAMEEVPEFHGFELPKEEVKPEVDYSDMLNQVNSDIVNTGNLDYSAFDVEDGQGRDASSYTMPIPGIEPTPAATTPEEKEILKEVEASTPTDLNDQVLKMEDTLVSNNLKEEIKEENAKDDSKVSKKAMIFVITIFVVLAALIFILPLL